MEFSNKKQALIYLDRNGLYYFELGLLSVFSLSFLETSVKDLDLVDEKSLDNQIQGFFNQNHLSPSNISIIISPNIIFEKDLINLDPNLQKGEIDKFLDTIPFANVASEIYPIEKGVKVIGVNEDLFLAVKNSFEKIGCVASLIIPYHALGNDSQLLNNFSTENLTQLIKRVDKFRSFNLLKLKIAEAEPTLPTEPSALNNKTGLMFKKNKRAIILGGVFLLLIGILVFMVMNMNKV